MEEKSEALKKRKRPSRWHLPIWYANLLAVCALLLSYLSIRVSPVTFWPLAFFGIAYPVILLANIACIVWWFLFRRKRMWPSLIAIVLGWGHLGEYVQLIGDRDEPTTVAKKFKVMSYNVRLFNLYNWTHNENTRDEILDLFRVEDPDILCLQEFLNVDKGIAMITRDTILKDFRYVSCSDAYSARIQIPKHRDSAMQLI